MYLWPTTIWVWYIPDDLTAFIDRLADIPGNRGILVKAADSTYTWGQWRPDVVQRFKDAGIGVGMWAFCYGHMPEWGTTPQDEIDAVMRAIDRARPDALVLNVEGQLMLSPTPGADIADLISLAKLRSGLPVGISTVWHWAETMRWPFAEAVEAGVDYWVNQVYGTNWLSYTDYQRLRTVYGGGRPDFIALPGNEGAEVLDHMVEWALSVGADGLSYWEARQIKARTWEVIKKGAIMQENTETSYNIGQGVRDEMKIRGERALSDEMYYATGNGEFSLTASDQALYIWHQSTGKIARVPWV
jgi:hypothetical protein